MRPAQLLHCGDDPDLRLKHRFTIRWPTDAPRIVPEYPTRVLRQIRETQTRPSAEVDLDDFVRHLRLPAEACSDGIGGFPGALKGACADARDILHRKAHGNTLRLRPPRFSKCQTLEPAAKNGASAFMRRMPHQEESGGH